MRYQITILTLMILTSLFAGSHVASQTPQNDSGKPLYFATGNDASVVGTISVTGSIPKPLLIDMTADPACVELVPKAETDWFMVHENRLQNVFVYVKGDLLDVYRFAVPESEVTLERKNCRYSPHVVGMQVGQRLQILNSDPTHHNTHPTPKLNPEWNQTLPPGVPPLIKTFSRPEVLIPFKCNQHPWEKAYVAVLKHPYFGVSDASGRFEIHGLPAGFYKLVVWHEKLGEQEMEITLTPGETRSANFTFDADKKP